MLVAFLFPMLGQASPNNFNFQANIRKPDGSRLEDSNVSYRFSYLNNLGTCTLYIEDFNNVSMVGSGGNISFSMGTGTKVFPPASVSLSETFSNNTSNLMSCSEGGSYTPLAATEIRKLKVEFVYTGSGGLQSLNGIEISSVPYSMYSSDSDRLGGVMASLFAKISDFQTCSPGEFLYKDGAGHFYCDTPSSFTGNLAGDVTGTQSSTTVARLRGIPLAVTAPTVNQVLQFDGTNWVPQTIAAFGGTVTNVSSSNLYLTVSNPTTTPTLTLNVGTGANTVAAGDDSRIVGAFQTATTLGGDLSGTLPNPTVATVGGKTAAQISTSVDDTLNATNVATASRIVKRDSSGNASFVTAQATNFSGRNLILFEPTDTNYVTVKAPTTFTGGNYIFTLPESKGLSGQVLSTDGNGVTSWIPASTGSVTSVGATLPLTSTGGATPIIAMPAAATAQDGYLTAANWNTFNNKLSTTLTAGNIFVGNASNVATSTALSGDILSVSDTGVVALKNTGTAGTYGSASAVPTITTDAQGRVTGVTTNAYQDATAVTKGVVSVGTNLQVTGGVISLQNASTTNTGALTNTDWNTFNNKQPAGNYITALTGDVTAAGPGSSVATIANLAVTNAKINDVAFSKITGLPTTLSGYGITDSIRNAGVGVGNVVSSIQSGNTAGRPAFGTDGRIYIDTQAGVIYRDSGAAWVAVASTSGSGGTVTNVTAGAPLLSSGGANPNITMPAATAAVDGYLSAADFTAFNNKVSSQWITSGSNIYNGNVGNVGIGIASPSQKLQVAGSILVNTEDNFIGIDSGIDSRLGLIKKSGTYPAFAAGNGAPMMFGHWSTANLANNIGSGTFTEDMRIDATGQVGIGTNNPTSKLTVTGGTASSPALRVNSTYSRSWNTEPADVAFASTNPIGSGITLIPSASGTYPNGWTMYSGTGSSMIGDGSFGIWNATTADAKFMINQAGNVGIGRTTANYKLDVNGDINIPAGSNFKINGVNIGSGTIGGSGTTNKISKFTAAGTIGDSNIIDNGTTVEISTDATVNGINIGLGAGALTGNQTVGTNSLASITTGTSNTAVGFSTLNLNADGANNSAFGTSALAFNTSGNSNTALGSSALRANTTGGTNVGVGTSALTTNTTGTANVAIGFFSGFSNTTGAQNTALGTNALQQNVTGNTNTAIGRQSLRNTTGSGNIGLGYNSGFDITTGSSNVVIGSNTGSTIATSSNNIIISDGAGNIRQQIDSSGRVGIGMAPATYMLNVNGDINIPAGSNFKINGTNVGTGTVTGTGTIGVIPKFTAAGAIGDSNINDNGMFVIVSTDTVINSVKDGRGLASVSTNTAVGTNSLGTNTTGNQNTANGYFTLYLNTTGTQNTATGSGALYNNTTGSRSTAVGASSLNQNTTGTDNTAVGFSSLTQNTTGHNNTAVGISTLASNTTGYYNSAFGGLALNANTTGNVNAASGFQALYYNTTGSSNAALGFQALYNNISGDDNTGIGARALTDNTTGYNNSAMGADALANNTTGTYNTASGSQALLTNTTGSNNTASGMYALRANTVGDGNTTNGSNSMFSNTTGSYNVANGHQALYYNTTGSYNVATGYQALFNNTTAGSNVAYGSQSLNSNTTGNSNVAIGSQTLFTNTTGGSNTATGSNALRANTTGMLNAAFGHASLYSNTTGLGNVAVGSSSQYTSTTANYNASLGYQALYSATTGGNNTAIGTDTLYYNTTGNSNSAVGYRSLYSNTTGINNTGIGSGSLYTNSTGNFNTASGNSALYANTTGSNNTATGYLALTSNTTGSSNNAYGRLSLRFNTTGFSNSAFGNNALTTNTTGYNNAAFGEDSLSANTTGNNNVSFGIGSMAANTTGTQNAALGYQTLNANTTGNFNVGLGYGALSGNTVGNQNIAIGSSSGSALTSGDYNVILGANTGSTINGTSNNILISDGSGLLRASFNSSGNLGIGVAPTTDRITVFNGTTTGTYTTSGWMHSSDARLKHDITPLQNSLDKILRLKGVEYTFNNDPANTKQIGFIAQQVEPIFPEVVRTDKKGFKSMIYSNLVAPIIEAIKSLKLMTDTNTREIASLKAENAELKKQLEKQNKDMEQIKKKLGL